MPVFGKVTTEDGFVCVIKHRGDQCNALLCLHLSPRFEYGQFISYSVARGVLTASIDKLRYPSPCTIWFQVTSGRPRGRGLVRLLQVFTSC